MLCGQRAKPSRLIDQWQPIANLKYYLTKYFCIDVPSIAFIAARKNFRSALRDDDAC